MADPRSKKALADLATFVDSERFVQLCDLEAMEQIEAWKPDLHPQNVVSYARANEKITGETMVAEGAAVSSGTEWYNLKFKCEVSPSHDKVIAFEFKLGEAVPHTLWEEYGLTEDDDGDPDD